MTSRKAKAYCRDVSQQRYQSKKVACEVLTVSNYPEQVRSRLALKWLVPVSSYKTTSLSRCRRGAYRHISCEIRWVNRKTQAPKTDIQISPEHWCRRFERYGSSVRVPMGTRGDTRICGRAEYKCRRAERRLSAEHRVMRETFCINSEWDLAIGFGRGTS